ncbi:hypothetical protein [Paenibacillus methanolicus]|uniref:Lipoprotein n=1 Tax=Paenibacillus methanolicus TaxID=582686 RepID=A0A5S5CAU5_9BACL|nr:hypothetical protein [Paenibacillus methanolicus]TYP75486.1 hypothetical protein BCM02_104163 [Paenibacillus methanolicus]
MKRIRWAMTLIVVAAILLGGCSGGGTEGSPEAAAYLESKGYQNVRQEGRVVRYVINGRLLSKSPTMEQWGLQDADPSAYFGQTIAIERYVATGSPVGEGEVSVSVFMSGDKPLGGFVNVPGGDEVGYSLDGKTLEEVSGKPYEAWKQDWLAKYGG